MTEMQFISLFEQSTGARVKDCINDEHHVLFIVHQEDIAKAIGKKGAHVRELERALRKKVRVVAFSEDPRVFVANLIAPSQAQDIQEEEGIITITSADTQSRGYIIGRNAANLRATEAIVQRYYPIKEIKVH